MEWVEGVPTYRAGLVLPRPTGQPVFVDPHGHRVRRLRHAARVVAGAAGVYLALLALGLAGPASPPFSLFPGTGAKAGEKGTEAVHTESGAASTALLQDASAGGPLLGGALIGLGPGATGVDPASPGATPPGAAPIASPGAQGTAPVGSPSADPAGSAGHGGSAPQPVVGPSGHSPRPSGAGSPPPSGAGSPPASSPAQGNGPPAGHVPPGQAKKASGSPSNGNGNGNGNGNAYGPP